MIARIMRPQTADRVDRIRGGDRYLPELSRVGVGDSEEIVGFVSMLGKKLPRRNFGMASSTSLRLGGQQSRARCPAGLERTMSVPMLAFS